MSRLALEDFGAVRDARRPGAPTDPAPGDPGGAQDALERARLAGYEDGYRAGWDDAARKEAEEQGRIGAEFARNLQDLGFTFHEARAHVMQALEPLLAEMIEKVLPGLVRETLGQSILEELLPLVAEAADAPIEIVVTPVGRAPLEAMLGAAVSVPLRVVEEETLADGQVYLRTGKLERRIDMARVIERIGAAVRGLYEINEGAFGNG